MTKRQLYYLIPPSLRFFVRRLYYLPYDTWQTLTGKRDKNIPPKGLIFIGSGNFKEIGDHYLHMFRTYCQLQPNHRVLDIGCGIGRIALPLSRYLSPAGSYEGFDIVKRGISWCSKHISSKHPNFRFRHVDLKNDLYNTATNDSAKYFRFPYTDHDFNLVVLTSVFTHMMPDDVINYLREISRVLKPGGRCLATFFLLNEVSRQHMPGSAFHFRYNHGTYSLMDGRVKEANIAYAENFVIDQMRAAGLETETTLYGYWSGRPNEEAYDFQDTLILRKIDSHVAGLARS